MDGLSVHYSLEMYWQIGHFYIFPNVDIKYRSETFDLHFSVIRMIKHCFDGFLCKKISILVELIWLGSLILQYINSLFSRN